MAWNIVKEGVTGKVNRVKPSSGKGPGSFLLFDNPTEFKLWPSDEMPGFGREAEVIFDVDQSEYKNAAQYTARNLMVVKGIADPAVGQAPSDAGFALLAAAILTSSMNEEARTLPTVLMLFKEFQKTLSVEEPKMDLDVAVSANNAGDDPLPF